MQLYSIQEVIAWTQSAQSPFSLRLGQDLSLPFVGQHADKQMVTAFSYVIPFQTGDALTVHPGSVFYIDPCAPEQFQTVDISAQPPPEQAAIFPFARDPFAQGTDSAQLYAELVELTDALLRGGPELREMAQTYARRFCAYVAPELEPYYWHYGREYFTWLRELLCPETPTGAAE